MDYEIEKIKKIDGIKEVTSEAEYWEKHKYYKRRLRKLSLNLNKYIMDPQGYINKFELYLSEMLSYGVMNSEQIEEIRLKFYEEMSSSLNRESIIGKLNKVKNKFSKKKQ